MTRDEWGDAPGPWFQRSRAVDGRWPGGPHWQGLVEQMRRLQDIVAGSNPDDAAVEEATRHLARAGDLLSPFAVPEAEQAYGRRLDLPDAGQHLLPRLRIADRSSSRLEGTVTFSRVHLGAGQAVHGGIVGLVFDHLLGWLAHHGGRPPCRTAYLHIDYRALTPLDRPLFIAGFFRREEGRKRVVAGEIRDGDVVCAEAEALFIELRDPPPEALLH